MQTCTTAARLSLCRRTTITTGRTLQRRRLLDAAAASGDIEVQLQREAPGSGSAAGGGDRCQAGPAGHSPRQIGNVRQLCTRLESCALAPTVMSSCSVVESNSASLRQWADLAGLFPDNKQIWIGAAEAGKIQVNITKVDCRILLACDCADEPAVPPGPGLAVRCCSRRPAAAGMAPPALCLQPA